MSWIDPTKYKGYESIQRIVDITREVIASIDLKSEYNKFLDIGNYYPETHSSHDKVEWYGIMLYNIHTNTENRLEKIEVKNELEYLVPRFYQVTELIKRLPGISEASINFYAPNTTIPKHVDNQWFIHHNTLEGYRRCLGILCGIDMPSTDPELCSLTVNGDTRSWASGEFLGFDGLLPHWGWNKTDKFRVTMLIETFADYWDIDQSTLPPIPQTHEQH